MSLTKVSYAMINGEAMNAVDYGAICDGSTDNTTAVQAMFDALHASTSIKIGVIPSECVYTKASLTYYSDITIYDYSNAVYPSVVIGGGDAEYRIEYPNLDAAATNAPYLVLINRRTTGDRTSGIVGRYGTDGSPQNTWQCAFGRMYSTTYNPDLVLYSWQGSGQKARLILGGDGGANRGGGVWLFNPSSTVFDPANEFDSGAGYTYVFNSIAEADATDNMLANFYSDGTGKVGFDIRAGSNSYRNRIYRQFNDENLHITASDLTTDVVRINNGGSVSIDNGCSPITDGVGSLGSGSFRWNTVYAVTGTINTSDENEKTDTALLDYKEKAVALAIKARIKKFKFKSSVEEKGEKARIHFGVMAQDVKAAFEAEGLNAEDYGVFCSDKLEDGSVRLGVRYEELFAFILGAA